MFKYCLMSYPPKLRFSVCNVAPYQRLIFSYSAIECHQIRHEQNPVETTNFW